MEKCIAVYENKLRQYEEELEYQVSHKRIAFLQEQIAELEKLIADRKTELIPKMTDFMKRCDKGNRIFYSALHRKFGNDTTDIIRLIAECGYGTKDVLYRCPKCDFGFYLESALAKDGMLNDKTLICYCCDSEIKTENAIKEDLLIRTDKKA